jgi:hypothetical protein
MEYQQNFVKYPIAVFVLNASDNTYETLHELAANILQMLEKPLINGVLQIK